MTNKWFEGIRSLFGGDQIDGEQMSAALILQRKVAESLGGITRDKIEAAIAVNRYLETAYRVKPDVHQRRRDLILHDLLETHPSEGDSGAMQSRDAQFDAACEVEIFLGRVYGINSSYQWFDAWMRGKAQLAPLAIGPYISPPPDLSKPPEPGQLLN